MSGEAKEIRLQVEYVHCGELGVLVVITQPWNGKTTISLWTQFDLFMMTEGLK